MEAILAGEDSLVVLPTGGGKSLCYQAPAVARETLTVVVSPLISLMKDQVDSLTSCGIKAVQVNSAQAPEDRKEAIGAMLNGEAKLVFVSPERLLMEDFVETLTGAQVSTIAIDEAHCISHWGHDFRPEYRQLKELKYFFPRASFHAYTATATSHVREDIIEQLGLRDPRVIVGDFDRPNLTYRVFPRRDVLDQVSEIIERHAGDAGIVYCLSRKQVDALSAQLKKKGVRALAYHAGMSAEERTEAHDAFAAERCDVVVATIAFGMGIDRSNVRFVVHVGMPKSLEHYQQETGRAGRDGLEAECVLLYSGADVALWRSLISKSAEEDSNNRESNFLDSSISHLDAMSRYCRALGCRHASLVNYFGQEFTSTENGKCNACDVCLGEIEYIEDSDLTAQKILSCVARVREPFGVGHIVSVLRGENTQAVRNHGHQTLSTYGLLRGFSKSVIKDWIYQLIGQDVLLQTELVVGSGIRVPVIQLNGDSWEVMRGNKSVLLNRPAEEVKKSTADVESWEGVDKELFEELKQIRRELAKEKGCAPYIIAHDTTLRDLARRRPKTHADLLSIHGIGESRARAYGERFLETIANFHNN